MPVKSLHASNEMLKEKIASLSEKDGLSVESLHMDLCSMMNERHMMVLSNSAEGSSVASSSSSSKRQPNKTMLAPCAGIPR